MIGVGGTGPIGAAGQVLAGLELADQLAAAGVGGATVVLPSATGGTQAGVLTGLGLGVAADRTTSSGSPSPAPAADLRPTILGILDGLVALIGRRVRRRARSSSTTTSSARATVARRPAADEAASLLARTEGILVDPIYTAKALAGLIARVRDGRLTRARRVLARGRHARASSSRCRRPDGRQLSRRTPATRRASFIRAPVWSTAPE